MGVKVFGMNYSPYSLSVEIALKLKGVEYEYAEEDPDNKSEDLVKYNPIHKKVPVFVHHGKALSESLVILEYIDETWNNNDDYHLLPIHPYDRALARFWANFIDDKVMNAVKLVLRGTEGEKEKAREELKESIKVFEKEVEGKELFGGEKIGYLDLVAIKLALWVPLILEALDEEIFTKENYPVFCIWADKLLSYNIIKEKMPNRENLLKFYKARFAAFRNASQPS